MSLIQGCTDPQAINFDPTANTPCVTFIDVGGTSVEVVNGCCLYNNTMIQGCTDPLSPNYNPDATIDDGSCFQQLVGGGLLQVGVLPGRIDTIPITSCGISKTTLLSSTQIGVNGEVLVNGVPIPQDCCNSSILSNIIGRGTYIYANGNCYFNTTPPTNICPGVGDVVCVGLSSFNIWDNIYTSEFGQSIQIGNPSLWTNLVQTVNNGGSFLTYFNTGGLINETCCQQLNYSYQPNGICLCQNENTVEDSVANCVSTVEGFLNLPTDFFSQNFAIIGSSLGLSQPDITFIINNINNSNDSNGDGIPDLTEARLLLSNALTVKGGVYINFGVNTDTPSLVSQSDCSKISPAPGYWDGNSCMCNNPVTPPDQVLNCNLTDVQVLNSFDGYNNSVQIVVQKGTTSSISQECCLKLKTENNLSWHWENPYCYASQKTASCLPITFNLNENQVTVEPCESGVEVFMWIYFGVPKNSCNLPENIVENNRSVIISQEEPFSEITISPNTGLITSEPPLTSEPEVVIPIQPTPPDDAVVTPAGGSVIFPGAPVDGTITEENTFLNRSPNIYIPEANSKTFSVKQETPTPITQNGTNSSTNITNNVNKRAVKTVSSKDSLLNLKIGTDVPKKNR